MPLADISVAARRSIVNTNVDHGSRLGGIACRVCQNAAHANTDLICKRGIFAFGGHEEKSHRLLSQPRTRQPTAPFLRDAGYTIPFRNE